MRRLWLLFSQFVTVLLALWFVVLTLKPQWPQDWQSLWQKWRSPAISLNAKGQSTAPLAQPVVGQSMSFRDAVKVAAPSVVSISTSRAADDPAAAKDPWFRFFFGEQGENSDGEGEAQRPGEEEPADQAAGDQGADRVHAQPPRRCLMRW